MIKISVIIPVKDEAESIDQLIHELRDHLSGGLHLKDGEYEIIFVDDGSVDSTAAMIEFRRRNDIKLIHIWKSVGKSKALDKGFTAASGEIIITMDGDLQDNPSDIMAFVDAIKNNDVVVGWRANRKDGLGKKIPSAVYNYLNRKLLGAQVHDLNCGFKVYRRKVLEDVSVYGDMHRYLPIFAAAEGYRVGEVKVDHRPRRFGKSKYGLKRIYGGFLDLFTVVFLTKYGQKPMHAFSGIALPMFVLGIIGSCWVLYRKFMFDELIYTDHLPMFLISLIAILVSFILFSIGFLGELMAKWNSKKH